jgi:chemosensory pili system protein ChpA (sensor histidine kinase/response regulator)
LSLRASERDQRLIIEIEDDGRGISWERLADRARAAGLPGETRQQLVEAMFSDGVTTRQTTSDISGRGVGMAVVRAACVDTGGHYDVWSEPGRGSRFEFSWPLSVIEAQSAAEDAAVAIPPIDASRPRPTL